MKTNKKFIVLALIMLIVFSGCSGKKKLPDIRESYPDLSENTHLVYASQEDVISMLAHGTGAVLFTWKDCVWCQKYVQFVDSVSEEFDIKVLCYDIYEDREGDTKFYQEVVGILSKQLEEAEAYDETGKLRIYVPDITFVAKGRIIGHDNQSSMLSSDLDIDAYWEDPEGNGQSREYNLKKKLCQWGSEVCKYLEEIENRGCSECPVK